MEQAKREVNTESEVIDADDIKGDESKEEEEDENLDEEVIPPVKEGEEPKEESAEESKEESKEEETEEESEEQPKEEEAPESSPEDEEVEPPKPVEGETPREKALRLEVQRLKKDRRKGERTEMLKGAEAQPLDDDKEYNEIKEQYTPEELTNMEKLMCVFVKKQGYVL